MPHTAAKLAFLIVALGLLPWRLAAATVLTFDFVTPKADGTDVPAGYGDRVTGLVDGDFIYGGAGGFTPNVEASYGPLSIDVHLWANDYGDLTNVIYREAEGAGILELTLTADAGFEVLLDSFDLAGWPTTTWTIDLLEVRDGLGTPLFSQTDVTVLGAGPAHSDFEFATPLAAESLTVHIDSRNLGAGSDNIGLDNVQFRQRRREPTGVPEPNALLLLGAGLAGLGFARRRR